MLHNFSLPMMFYGLPVPLLPALRRATVALTTAAALGAAAAPAAAQEPPAHVPGEVVVRYAPGADRQDRAEVQRETGARAPEKLAERSRVLTIADGESLEETLAELRAQPGVAAAAPNAIARISGPFFPDDPGTGGDQGWQALQWNFLAGAGVNAPEAWGHLIDAGRPGGRGTVVAVLDTGVAYASRGRFRRSPDFGPGDFVAGRDFVDGDRRPHDENGHGTHVASTIGEATHNGRGVTGLAYGARIMPVRVLDRNGAGDSVAITRGIRYAVRNGADVINLSFEFDDPNWGQVRANEIPEIVRALRHARRAGVVVVGAAGNLARRSASYPARAPGVIGVAATTEHGCKARYSNTGAGVDLAAPGGGRDDTDDVGCPQGVDPRGRDIYQMTFPWASSEYVARTSASYRRFGLPGGFVGTSMAAPHVAAAAALVIASGVVGADPSPAAVERRLRGTATDVGLAGADPAYGAGRLDAAAATDPGR